MGKRRLKSNTPAKLDGLAQAATGVGNDTPEKPEQPVTGQGPPITVPSDEDVAALMQKGDFRLDAFWRTRDELMKRQLSDTENLDRSLLTLSSGALGVSITFLNAHHDAVWVWLLVTSWFAFGISILSVLFSYFMSQKSLDLQQEIFQDYYLKCDDGALERKDIYSARNERLVKTSAIAFCVGIFLMLTHFSINHAQLSNGAANAGQAITTHQSTGRSESAEAGNHSTGGVGQGTDHAKAAQQPTAERKVDERQSTKSAASSTGGTGQQAAEASNNQSTTPGP